MKRAKAAADFGGSRAIFASSFGHADALTAYDAESAAVLKSWSQRPPRPRLLSLNLDGENLDQRTLYMRFPRERWREIEV